MVNVFSKFMDAVAAGDATRTRSLLKQHPGLLSTNAPTAILTPVHWIYAGDSALHVAAAWHRPEATRQLLSLGADPSALNRRGATPLHYAADGQPDFPGHDPVAQAAVIRLLIKAGADPDAQDKNGATPLHRAVRTRSSSAVKALLANGADRSIKNHGGSTALVLARLTTGRGGSGSPKAKGEQQKILKMLA